MEEIIRIWRNILWVTIILQTMARAANVTTPFPDYEVTETVEGYAWSAWSSWSPCSRTCGGGVSMQERECLPRSNNVPDGTLPPPVITVRVTRQIHSEECAGVDKRYRECNTAPCSGTVRSLRAEQCTVYDRRPFRGRFYTWVPYIDGDSPCTLNCRPLGQQFYASLGVAADGTPCTKPGFRAICVQGTCKVVGRETVLAGSGGPEVRCGRRLVSGLFSRPRLPIGYSYVTTVPRGACRLNVSEIVPSENYIALKITNGSYIMNGEFAVSAAGTYEAVGARFLYSRTAGLDHVFAAGPIHHPIDIMILYTQPKPSIIYEYLSESLPDEIDDSDTKSHIADVPIQTKHSRRHQNYDIHRRTSTYPDLSIMSKESHSSENSMDDPIVGQARKFVWKILSHTQCTRSCGGGIQLGKYRCVETSVTGDREVSSVHCSGSPPVGKRRRCGMISCPPRWRTTSWSSCPRCGPAIRTRIVGCVQDHSRGITKISDLKCPPSKPATVEKCNIPNCDTINTGEVRHIEPKRAKQRDNIDAFHDGPVYTVALNNSDFDIGPSYNLNAAAEWLYTEWSECVGWCVGGGIQTRNVRCADPSGCAPRKAPDSFRSCTPKALCDPLQGHWFTGEWTPCSSTCEGIQVRGVLCIGGTGRHLRESACKEPRPELERKCAGDCPPAWYISDWGQCVGNCSESTAVQRRTVVCTRSRVNSAGVSDEACAGARPHAQRPCLTCPLTLPPQLKIESRKTPAIEVTTTQKTPQSIENEIKTDCEDKLSNCALAVQARLCHYKFYIQNCCSSCASR